VSNASPPPNQPRFPDDLEMSQSLPETENLPLSGNFKASSSLPGKKSPRKNASALLLVILIGVFAAMIFWRWDFISDLLQLNKAGEQEALAKLTERGLLIIAEGPDKQVTSINFWDTKKSKDAVIDDEMLSEVAKLYRLSTLNASNSKITNEQLRYFSGLRSLTCLDLGNTPVTDEGLVHLCSLKNLDAFYVANTAVTDRGLEHIVNLSSLKILNLCKTKVTDEGLKKLQSLPKLNWLLLSETGITDAGLDNLSSIQTLGRLTIAKAKVTSKGIERLKKAIPGISVDQ
jgi:hypothetical protein